MSISRPQNNTNQTPDLTVFDADASQLSDAEQRHIQCDVKFGLKRALDVVLMTGCLMVFAPIMVVIAALVKMTSKGPVLFLQERICQYGKPFTIYKFRTMVNDAESATGPVWADKNDSRITPLGNILRKTHLDELPQLFNVVSGDMSFVGPRPERPVFTEKFEKQGIANYTDRHLVKPGITGFAQLQNSTPSLESLDDIREKTEADLWYVENWTFNLDLWILWQTGIHFATSIFYVLIGKKEASADRNFADVKVNSNSK